MKSIISREGKIILCSDQDYPAFSALEWRVDKSGYAYCWTGQRLRRMHNLIRPPRPGYEVDHKNEVKLDNRRENLQYLTPTEHRQKTQRMRDLGLNHPTPGRRKRRTRRPYERH